MSDLVDVKDKQLSNDLALLGEAARDLTAGDMVGVPLKFVRGVWSKKNTDQFIPVTPTQQFIVDVLSYEHGWIRWEDKKPTHRFMGRKVDGFPLPVRSRLPEPDLENTPDDPWQETHRIVMRDLGGDDCPKPTHNGLCTFTTTSWGGRKALGRLIDEFINQVADHPGKMPVVYLGSKDKAASKGIVANPVFTIVDWKAFGPGASPPGRRIAAPSMPQLTHVADADDDDGGFGEPTIMSNGKETKPWDDDIPF